MARLLAIQCRAHLRCVCVCGGGGGKKINKHPQIKGKKHTERKKEEKRRERKKGKKEGKGGLEIRGVVIMYGFEGRAHMHGGWHGHLGCVCVCV